MMREGESAPAYIAAILLPTWAVWRFLSAGGGANAVHGARRLGLTIKIDLMLCIILKKCMHYFRI